MRTFFVLVGLLALFDGPLFACDGGGGGMAGVGFQQRVGFAATGLQTIEHRTPARDIELERLREEVRSLRAQAQARRAVDAEKLALRREIEALRLRVAARQLHGKLVASLVGDTVSTAEKR